MTRKLSTLGLVLAASFALCAVTASDALAGKVTAAGPVTLAGTQTGAPSANSFTGFGGETQCPNATYTGHKQNVTPHESIPSGAEEITITPHYGSCTSLGLPATIDMNGCDYQLRLEQTTETDRHFARTYVVCPSGHHITVTIFTSLANHTANKSFCHITITENIVGYAGAAMTTTTNGYVDLTGTAGGLAADKKSPTGSILCPEEASATTSINMDITFSGRNSFGEGTFVSLSD